VIVLLMQMWSCVCVFISVFYFLPKVILRAPDLGARENAASFFLNCGFSTSLLYGSKATTKKKKMVRISVHEKQKQILAKRFILDLGNVNIRAGGSFSAGPAFFFFCFLLFDMAPSTVSSTTDRTEL